MVTQVVQFRLDTNIAKKFEKNCDLLNQTKTDTLTLLVENFNKNFREVVNLDETFSVNVNIFPKEPRNEFSLLRYSPMSRPNNHKIKIELG